MVKVKCTNEVGYNDIKLNRFVDHNEVIEVDEERAKYLVEARGLCERIEEDKPEENTECNEDDNLDDETNENIDNNKSHRKGKK